VQKDSPFCGSKQFGMCYVDNEGRLAAVGTVLQVQDYALVQVSASGAAVWQHTGDPMMIRASLGVKLVCCFAVGMHSLMAACS
jgi:hypothetical protein